MVGGFIYFDAPIDTSVIEADISDLQSEMATKVTQGGDDTGAFPLEVGTKTAQPFVITTNSLARIRVLANGRALVQKTTDTGEALQVGGTVQAERLKINGAPTPGGATGLTIDMTNAPTSPVMLEFVSGAAVNRIRHATNQFLFDSRINSAAGVFVRSTSASNLNTYGIDAVNNTLEFMANGQKGAVFPTTGNWIIQNGGAFIDSGHRLDINGTLRAQAGAIIGSGAVFSASAVLQVDSTTKGFAPPRMTTADRILIASPLEGLMVYDTTLKTYCFYDGTAWRKISHSLA